MTVVQPVEVEVYADVLCPWCYIGKRRLTAALSGIPERDDRIRVTWRSFELGPDGGRTPGPTAAEAMEQWWGTEAASRVERIRALGAAEGLELNMHVARPVSTFDAHRLCHLAAGHGLADPMMERLLRAYHTEGLNVADPAVLRRLGVEAGLDVAEVEKLLAGDDHADSVRADERRASELGATGVPSLLVDGNPPVSGVQSATELRNLLMRALRAAPGVPGGVGTGSRV